MEKLVTKLKAYSKYFLPVILILHFVLLLKTQFTAWPEMTLWPYLVTEGWLPYKDIGIAHTPLLIFLLSIVTKVFGSGIIQLKIFTWILILCLDILVYFVAKKLFNKKNALLSVAAYLLLQTFFGGNGLWFDLALVPFILLTYLFLKEKKYLLAGIFWTLAFLTKQTAFWFLFPIGFLLFKGQDFKFRKAFYNIECFIIGILVILLVFLLSLFILGILSDFIFWAVKFGVFYLPGAKGQIHLPNLKELLVGFLPFSFLVLYLIFEKGKKELDLILFSIFGVLGVYPRWELFHFQPALPFLALIIALILEKTKIKDNLRNITVLIFLAASLIPITRSFIRNWGKEDRFYEKEVQEVVKKVEEKTNKGDRIYVVNYWDSLYALTDTYPSVKPWIPYLPWYLNYSKFSEFVISKLKINQPKIIVVAKYEKEGLGSYQLPGLEKFISNFYYLSDNVGGRIDIYSKNK